MRAQYPGQCGVCSRPIAPGDEIVSGDRKGRWIHEPCSNQGTLLGSEEPLPTTVETTPARVDSAGTVVYTDGSCLVNPGGPGGWAWATDAEHHRSGPDPVTTNQRMEIRAAYEAVKAHTGPLVVVSDSQYVVNCFVQHWWRGWHARGWVNSAKKPVANRDLWEPFIDLVLERGDVTFEWVKGHNGHAMNEFVDQLAAQAAQLAAASLT